MPAGRFRNGRAVRTLEDMKKLARVLLVLVAALAIAVGFALLNLDRIIRRAVERESTASLRLNTSLAAARAALLGGTLNLHDLEIASPKGFSAVHMLTLDDLDVKVRLRELRDEPIHVSSLRIGGPTLVIEQSKGTLNFRKAMQLIPEKPESKEPLKVIIDDLQLADAHVIVRPGLPGVAEEIDVKIPLLHMKDVGRGKGANNGAAIKDVVMQVIAALAGKAAQSDALPAQLKALLHLNVGQVIGQLDALAQKQIRAALPGELGSAVSDIAKSPGTALKEPGKALEGLRGLAGGSDKKASAKEPAGRRPDGR